MRLWINLFEGHADIIGDMEKAAEANDCMLEATFVDPDDSVYGDVADFPIDLDRTIVINDISASRPQHGDGSRAMNSVCAIADQHRIAIVLDPFSRLGRDALVKWYLRFGFVEASGSDYIYRAPRG